MPREAKDTSNYCTANLLTDEFGRFELVRGTLRGSILRLINGPEAPA